jgi:hypothetical protein
VSKCFRIHPIQATVTAAFIVALALLIPTAKASETAPPPPMSSGDGGVRLSPPDGIDLDVTYINRVPMYQAYCDEYVEFPGTGLGLIQLCPGTEGEKRWPEHGEVVTFTAHIVNKGTLPSGPFTYTWFIDGSEVLSGTHAGLTAAAEGTAVYNWPWAHTMDGERVLDDHTVRFTVDPNDAIAETCESNNSLEDRTNALSFVIAMTPEMYEVYNVPITSTLPFSAEDWLQKQIAAMNKALADSVYPVTPQGATERVRIDRIVITTTLPSDNRQHDGAWFIKDEVRNPDWSYYWYDEDIDWGLVHELSHQIGLIDLYTSPIDAVSVRVLDREGFPVNFGFDWPRPGVMFGGDIAPHPNPGRFPHYYSSHSAGGVSSVKGYRDNFYGTYQYDIPEQNALLVLDSQGNPAAGVQVALYQRTAPFNWVGLSEIDNVPEISGTTDMDGRFVLPNRSAQGGVTNPRGQTLGDNPFGVVDIIGLQNRFLLKLNKGEHEEFHWMDITQFNLAYWMGDTLSHTFPISSHVPPLDAPAPPEITTFRTQGLQVALDWRPSPSPGVVGYRVYRAAHLEYRYEWVADVAGTHFEEDFVTDWNQNGHRVYAVTAVNEGGLESGFSNAAYTPRLGQPYDVAVAPDGASVVLDPSEAYPLLVRQRNGRYSHALVSTHHRLGNARFVAVDPAGRLLVGDAGDPWEHPPSVRVFDSDGTPHLEFGGAGSGPGQFDTPTGVAWWGPPCTFGGLYDVDEHTLLLLHFDGTYAGAESEVGTANGTSFESGRYGQGVLIDDTDTLTYTTEGNLNLAAGTIEFWVRPNFDSAASEGVHTLFETEDPWDTGGIQIAAGGGNVGWIIWAGGSVAGVHTSVDWQAGEWHHVAAAWREHEMWLYVDGQMVDKYEGVVLPAILGPVFRVGSTPNLGWQADAVFDELRISDVPRLGNSDACGRFLVADGGNHRVQAFDGVGNLVASFGGIGTNAGQFNAPQGLAVAPDGQVIVADQGNDRLVVLSFDGTNLGFVRVITAGLNQPTDVATFEDYVVVADTGNNEIKVLDGAGALLFTYTAPGDGYTGPFGRPSGIAVDAMGTIIVADTGNGRVVTLPYVLSPNKIWLPLVLRH